MTFQYAMFHFKGVYAFDHGNHNILMSQIGGFDHRRDMQGIIEGTKASNLCNPFYGDILGYHEIHII